MGNLVNSLTQNKQLMGCRDTIVLGPHCTAQVVNYRASADTVINDPVESGCYISVMGVNDAYSPNYPDYLRSATQARHPLDHKVTCLLHLIAAFHNPTHGQIKIGGKTLENIGTEQLYKLRDARGTVVCRQLERQSVDCK